MTKLKDTEKAARESGYVRSPNNIFNIPGSRWYAGGPGIPEITACGAQVFISVHERPVALYVSAYGKPEPVLCMRFKTWGDFWSYALLHGTRSKPGRTHIPGRFINS